MQSQMIRNFADFLSRPPKSFDEIAQFLVMNTFASEKFINIFIGELITTGVIHPVAGFGWTVPEYAEIPEIPIHLNYPLSIAIRTKEIVLVKSGDEFVRNYPLIRDNGSVEIWISSLSIPVYPFGGMTLHSNIKLELTETMKVFYIAIGSLLGLYASRLPSMHDGVDTSSDPKIKPTQTPLSGRQEVIVGLIERGFNNAQIATEIGYSESLVRQETIAIYAKLQVSGRKALQELRAMNRDLKAEVAGQVTPADPEKRFTFSVEE